MIESLPERLSSKIAVIPGHPCWEWVGALKRNGYGSVGRSENGRRISEYAHRAVFEAVRGPIQAGLQLDHLCRNRACVNPAHLEPVTQRENILRGESLSAVCARRTHCVNGHALTLENIWRRAESPGARNCRECKRVNDRAARRRDPQRAKLRDREHRRRRRLRSRIGHLGHEDSCSLSGES